MRSRRRLVLLLPAFALGLAWFVLGPDRRLVWSTLAEHQGELRAWALASPVLAAAGYCLAYAGLVALSLPLGGLLTITGGLLFGAALGAVLAALAATAGATLLFLLVRSVGGAAFARRAGPLLDTVRSGVRRDGFSFLLAMRLVPVVPFWLGNLAPALAGMRLLPFATATLIGITPATVVLAGIGAGVGDVLAAGGTPDLAVLLGPSVLLPLLGLAALSLLPAFWRRWPRRRAVPPAASPGADVAARGNCPMSRR